jgi:hypothetical protein
LRDDVGRRHFRRQGEHRAPALEAAQQRYRVGIEQPQMLGIVDAAARLVEKGSLDVNTENPRGAGVERGLHGADGPPDRVEIVADQGRQEARGAEAAVRRADGADRFAARVIVEQHAAAAVHLYVDESGQQQLSLQIDAGRVAAAQILGIHQRFDACSGNQQRLTAHDSLTGQQPAVDECAAH